MNGIQSWCDSASVRELLGRVASAVLKRTRAHIRTHMTCKKKIVESHKARICFLFLQIHTPPILPGPPTLWDAKALPCRDPSAVWDFNSHSLQKVELTDVADPIRSQPRLQCSMEHQTWSGCRTLGWVHDMHGMHDIQLWLGRLFKEDCICQMRGDHAFLWKNWRLWVNVSIDGRSRCQHYLRELWNFKWFGHGVTTGHASLLIGAAKWPEHGHGNVGFCHEGRQVRARSFDKQTGWIDN